MKTVLHFLLFSITFFFYIITAICGKCVENQQLSLLDLKKSLIFDSSVSSKLISWNASVDCCSWVGVTCSNKGHVVGLDISSEFISSSIDSSSSLFHLQHLQRLNLACNDFNGSKIPATVGKLTKLKYLNLSSAEFFGQIPIEISKLTRLVILDMSENYHTSGPLTLEKPNLSMLVQNLKQLTELYLDVVPISAEGTEWCQAISSLPNLRVLSLSICALSGPFHESLAALQSLSVVRLDNNRFRSPVPGFFANFSNLTFLSLRNSELHGTFPDNIFQVPALQTIDISNNLELHGSLPKFSKNNSLRSLVVRGTSFSGVLPESIGNLMQLSIIDISNCNFTGLLPMSMGNLTQLVHLEMSKNTLHGPIDSIHWESLTNLLHLALDSNLINGRIPSSIFSPPLLEELLLSNNQLSGQIPKLSNISSESLSNLDLSRNNLKGPISASLLYLRGLRQVDLSSNNFSEFPFHGPQQLGNLKGIDLSQNSLVITANESNASSSTFPQIETLILSSNKLRTFPHIIINHSRLYYLDLSENQMQGEIPNWIWGLSSLQHLNVSCNSFGVIEAPSLYSSPTVSELDLHSNKFQGQIPIFLPFATYLDYSRNHFSSTIPSNIGTFISSSVFISLSRNKLYGTIPESICNILSYLEVLDLSHNSLGGSVPECLITMSISHVLNLRGNNLTGRIPDTFLEDCGLRTLDLSENDLKGQVPKSLANCQSLEILNLGENQITDTFPCSLKKISTLGVLLLRSNKFHGGIECSESFPTWLSLRVIDLSHNLFSGGISEMSFPSSPAESLPSRPGIYGVVTSAYGSNIFTHEYGGIFTHEYGGTNKVAPDKYFEDAIKFTSKGLYMELVKMSAAFTLIDFSCNKFNGSIPEYNEFYTSLHVYNLSNNDFSGEIPSSFGYMLQLESLDLSQNHLTGKIPQELAELTFLSFLNVSNNQLVGRIPTGPQFSTFSKASFAGNKGLWGPPLDDIVVLSPPALHELSPKSAHEIDWDLIIVEMGFVSGVGVAIGSLIFCTRWRRWYYRVMYNIVLTVIPQLDQRIGNHRRHVYIARRWRY